MTATDAVEVRLELLRDWPLPAPSPNADKEARGNVLVIAGSREMPGAALLAATAAMRAGAGKLTIATAASIARQLGIAMPEARVLGLPESVGGGLLSGDTDSLGEACRTADAVLFGPGMQDDAATVSLVRSMSKYCKHASVVLDAASMLAVLGGQMSSLKRKILLTPHAGEIANLLSIKKKAVLDKPEQVATAAVQLLHASVALKGPVTVIATSDGKRWRHQGGNSGLASSGSGDVLAGIIAGLAARGAPIAQAAVWGVALHALAGEQLALRHGPLGYLSRDISGEVPSLMRLLARQ